MSKKNIVRAGAEALAIKREGPPGKTILYRARADGWDWEYTPDDPALLAYIASELRCKVRDHASSLWASYPSILAEVHYLPELTQGEKGWIAGSCAFANDCQRIAAALVALGEWTLEQAKEEFDETS